MARYFNFFSILAVATILYSCSDNFNEPAEVQNKKNLESNLKITLKGKIEFEDGTVFESWDKPKTFVLSEKKAQRLLQKMSDIPVPIDISRDFYYTLFSLSGGGYITIYSGSIVTFSDYVGYTYDPNDCIRNPRVRGLVDVYSATSGANFYCGIRSSKLGTSYYGTNYRTDIPVAYGTITGVFFPFYSNWWCGGVWLEVWVTIDYSSVPYDFNKKVKISGVTYHLRADGLML